MIGQNDHLLKADESAMLNEAMARFLASGGEVTKVQSGFCNPNPIAFIQPRIAPPKARKSRAKPPEEKKPRRPSLADLGRLERNAKLAEMAKTMTIPEVTQATGLSRNVLVGVAKRAGFSFLPVQAIDAEEDAKYFASILEMRDQGITRTACCRKLDISLTKLGRLLETGKIDYPTAGPGRPR